MKSRGGNMNKALIAFFVLGLLVATAACSSVKTSNIKATADIEKDANVGQNFTVQGTVVTTMKLGSISGYKLKDATGTIDVSSKNLPEENTTITVTGTLRKSTFFGYVLDAIE